MSFDFPASPAEGQTFNAPGGPSYVFNSPVWKAVGQGQIAIISDTAPSNPANGALWYESDTGILYIWYVDPNSAQWVQVGGITTAGAYVKLTGDSMNGTLTIRPVDAADADAVLQFADETGAAQGHLYWGRPSDAIALQAVTDAGAVSSAISLYGDISKFAVTATDTTLSGTLTVNGPITAAGNAFTAGNNIFQGTTNVILATNGAGTVYLRPNGAGSATGQMTVASDGTVTTNFSLVVSGNVTAGSGPGNSISVGTFSSTGATAGKNLTSTVLQSSVTTAPATNQFAFYTPSGNAGVIQTVNATTAYITTSDERLKDFIGLYDPQKAIDIIRRDPVRDFHWTTDGSYAVGWGAQTSYAVSEDLANAPAEDDPDGMWGIDQGRRTPYLWAALAWALDEIDDLKARVIALEARP